MFEVLVLKSKLVEIIKANQFLQTRKHIRLFGNS